MYFSVIFFWGGVHLAFSSWAGGESVCELNWLWKISAASCVQRSSKSSSSSSYASLNSTRGSATLANTGSAAGVLTNSGSAAAGALANSSSAAGAVGSSGTSVCEICFLTLPQSVCLFVLFVLKCQEVSKITYIYLFLCSNCFFFDIMCIIITISASI